MNHTYQQHYTAYFALLGLKEEGLFQSLVKVCWSAFVSFQIKGSNTSKPFYKFHIKKKEIVEKVEHYLYRHKNTMVMVNGIDPIDNVSI